MSKNIKKLIKKVMLDKEMQSGELADKLESDRQVFYNWLYKPDTEAFVKLINIADLLDCDVALVDRTTGQIYK